MLGILQNNDTIKLDDCSCAFIRHPEDGEVGEGGGGGRGREGGKRGSERQARRRLYGTNRDETQ